MGKSVLQNIEWFRWRYHFPVSSINCENRFRFENLPLWVVGVHSVTWCIYLSVNDQPNVLQLIADVFLTDYVMAVISSGRVGDQVALTSVLHRFQQPACVTFQFLLQESEPGTSSTLSVYLLTVHHVPIRLRLEERTVTGFSESWKRGYVYIPSGTYQVMFLATIGLPYNSDVYLDNIKLVESYKCDEDIIKPTGNAILL